MVTRSIPPLLIVICFCLTSLCHAPTVWASLKDPGLSEVDIRQGWKDYGKIMKNARVQGDYPYMSCFETAAQEHNLPLPLVIAVARGESDFDTTAVSSANCYGIMQIQWPGTAKDLGFTRRSDLTGKPCMNISAGARYLRWLIDRYEGDLYLAVAAYNRGPNAVSPGKVPEKGKWYAAYIHRHLQFVLKKRYEKTRRMLVLEYTFYKNAAEFMAYLEKKVPGIPFEIFKSRKYTYDIFLTYKTSAERSNYIKLLKDKTFIEPLGVKRGKGETP